VGLAAAMLATLFVTGCGDRAPSIGSPGVIDQPGGVKRVTLDGNYVAGTTQGWNLATRTITEGSADSDFHLVMAMVISLFPTTPMTAFCQKMPATGAPPFARVEDVPGDTTGCSWGTGYLGGNSEHSVSNFDGIAFVVRDRNGAAVAKLLMISDAIVAADVTVTFDIVGL
jgi:hypothetical protein